jgi:hypothetical protein
MCGSRQTVFAVVDILDSYPPGGCIKVDARDVVAVTRERIMSIGTILLVVLILILVGVLPVWPHASSWGYGPSGIVGVVLLVIIVLLVMGRL